MAQTAYVANLREIRDQIGRELADYPWDEWDRRIRETVAHEPGLAAMLARAVKPGRPQSPVTPRT